MRIYGVIRGSSTSQPNRLKMHIKVDLVMISSDILAELGCTGPNPSKPLRTNKITTLLVQKV